MYHKGSTTRIQGRGMRFGSPVPTAPSHTEVRTKKVWNSSREWSMLRWDVVKVGIKRVKAKRVDASRVFFTLAKREGCRIRGDK